MKIDLKFSENGFSAEANIYSFKTENDIKEFSFILNNSLKIDDILCNDKKAEWKNVGEEKPTFRSDSQKIVVSSDENIKNLIIKYSGSVSTWHNVITDDIKALSWYSVWYPQETSVELLKDEVDIHGLSDYFVVKGIYDEKTKIWKYGGRGFDEYNVIAYKKSVLKTVSNPYLNIYYVDESIGKNAEKAEFIYRDVLDYFNGELFEKLELPTLDMACLFPAVTYGGAYKRKDLIVTVTLGDNDLDTGWMTAHEMAHEWCSGADCDSWEDWLNETTAEWSALLYALKRNNAELFDFIIKPKLDSYDSLPAIKTPDGSRPDGVHNKGTVLFYEIYKKYGVEVVKSLVRMFVGLKVKTTEKLLSEVREKISPEVAEFIGKGIGTK
jgi:hypothetical protein